MFERKLTIIINELLKEFRIVYLTGPRQAGKTTLVKSLASSIGLDYLTFDDSNVLLSAQNDPILFIESIKQNVILDEFQYVPELIPAIKKISDNLPLNHKGKFLLTGSADIFRSGKTQEALPGHMARLELYPLSLSEKLNTKHNVIDLLCDQSFKMNTLSAINRQTLAEHILTGGYPEVQVKSDRAKRIWYKSYIEGRLYKDFESLYNARGNYRSKLKALVPYLAGLAGNLIKYSNIANDIQEGDKLIKSYMEILELMFIIKVIPAYIKNSAKREAITMPKLQMIDTGLACNLLGIYNQKQLMDSSYFGGLLENLIFMELYKQNGWSNNPVNLLHFRDKYQNEVDIVLEQQDNRLIGIEIKAASTIKPHDFKGLFKLAEYNPSKFQYGIIFYSGKEILPFSKAGIELYAIPISFMFQ